jgi:hypothetical protein
MGQIAVAQEKIRNKGWRIERIPWKRDGKTEWVHNTPLSLGLAILGLLVFLGTLALVLKEAIPKPAALLAFAGVGLNTTTRSGRRHQNVMPTSRLNVRSRSILQRLSPRMERVGSLLTLKTRCMPHSIRYQQ